MMPRRRASRDWSSTPRELRRRKPLQVTLSDEERAELERIAERADVKLSPVVAAAIAVLSALPRPDQRAAIAAAVSTAKRARAS